MNKITITILILMNLCLGQCIESVATNPFNMNWKEKVRDEEVEKALGRPDTMKILNDLDNVRYIYSEKMTCHFLMKDTAFVLYAIEMTGGDINGIKMGMSKRKVLNHLGKPNEEIATKDRITMEWNHGIHMVVAKFENRKLQEFIIAKVIH